jgi:xylulose-5-phosphate/fructose-6-phosphate phosphoketolase
VGYGYKPYFVEGSEPEAMHQLMAGTLDTVIEEIKAIQQDARTNGFTSVPSGP